MYAYLVYFVAIKVCVHWVGRVGVVWGSLRMNSSRFEPQKVNSPTGRSPSKAPSLAYHNRPVPVSSFEFWGKEQREKARRFLFESQQAEVG